MKKGDVKEMKGIIRTKQEELNCLLSGENVDKNEALKLSIELDELIYRYYCLIGE
ncbi:hypothetical protein CLPU_11c01050 [Gottschalkia purinilytica]|uniref:Spo0E like sporulation regulatory protein n=1 Tax=Gottschalkia purinilytica TaxID=1503 RepID=A0A0L0W907_GOTPU|nr:aspartyl-phosphate phosphatase Spo0E family protein [Gottschalkia purinilytica]KNF07936.1 hypothetical protein CLPU_11c01050 [Gottschalkia purinilytica]